MFTRVAVDIPAPEKGLVQREKLLNLSTRFMLLDPLLLNGPSKPHGLRQGHGSIEQPC